MTKKQQDFYRLLLAERWPILSRAEANAADKLKDREGTYTNNLGKHHRFLGIAMFLVDRDVSAFRSHLAKSAESKLSHFQRAQAGEPVDGSYLSMLAFNQLFDALAASAFPLAINLATIIGGRADIEQEHDTPFTRAMGYALKETVLDEGGAAVDQLNALVAGPERALDSQEERDPEEGLKYTDFRGYASTMQGIRARDERAVNTGLATIAEGHMRQSKRGRFCDDDDKYLCVWGLALANLARHRGIPVQIKHTLIPTELII
jgi:hypothetical protein